jgi:hypothetical protein
LPWRCLGDYVDGNFDTDTCVIDAGDIVDDCEL